MSGAYRREEKTDARDACVIAETARSRHHFATIDVSAQLAADLALLTAHRSDLVADRVRMINRLRDTLTGVFPALERTSDCSSHKGALVLLMSHQSLAALRRRGRARLTAWLAHGGLHGCCEGPRPSRPRCPAREAEPGLLRRTETRPRPASPAAGRGPRPCPRDRRSAGCRRSTAPVENRRALPATPRPLRPARHGRARGRERHLQVTVLAGVDDGGHDPASV
jgi:hypothetical protein